MIVCRPWLLLTAALRLMRQIHMVAARVILLVSHASAPKLLLATSLSKLGSSGMTDTAANCAQNHKSALSSKACRPTAT